MRTALRILVAVYLLKSAFAVKKMATNPANLPYHPGALRYYKEKGLVK